MFGYAIKSIFRTPVKTLLFVVLVSAVTVFSCLGFGMWNASEELIRNADKTYTTYALCEYIDENYPDSDKYSEEMLLTLRDFDYSLLSDQKEVLEFDQSYDLGGHIEGYVMNSYTPHSWKKSSAAYAVLLLRYLYTTERGDIFSVNRVLYSGGYNIRSGWQLSLTFDEAYGGLVPDSYEKGHYYIVHGQIIGNDDGTESLCVVKAENQAAPEETKGVLGFPFVDLGDDKESDRFQKGLEVLSAQARFYALMDSHLIVHPTTDVSLASPFLQQETFILEGGRYFTEEEYESGARVVILSDRAANSMNVTVGDTVPLDLYQAFTPSKDGSSGYRDFWPASQTYIDSGDYTIVGLFQNNENLLNTAYIPLSKENTAWTSALFTGYQLATARLKNGTGEDYYARVAPKLPGNVRMTIYDQGYSEAIAPVLSMRETAVLLSAVSAVGALVILLFFTFMFVSRQRDTAHTMIALGTGRPKTALYLIFCVLLIAVVSAAIGVLISVFLSENVSRTAYEQALETTKVDHRFSAVYSTNELRQLTTDFTPNLKSLILVGASVVLISFVYALIQCAGLLSQTKGEKERKLKEKKARHAKKEAEASNTKKAGTGRMSRVTSTSPALVSILRGGAKNLIVPLVSLTLIVFIGAFSGQIIDSEYEISDLYENSTVMGYFTTMNGWRINQLLLERDDVKPVAESSYVAEIFPTCVADAEIENHGSEGARVVFTKSISRSPQFFFAEEPVTSWAPGYDESCLLGDESVCVISNKAAERLEVGFGDELQLKLMSSYNFRYVEVGRTLKIVGIYNLIGDQDQIYAPMAFSEFPYSYAEYYHGLPKWYDVDVVLRYDSLVFRLRDLEHITEFKQELADKGFTTIGKFDRARKFIVIEDTLLNASAENLERHIAYMRILFGVTYLLSVIIGFVISYLMTKSRRKELAMMRSLGAGRVRTFLAFFLEQAGLAFIGGLLGILLILVVLQGVYTLQLYYFLGYFACYFLGIAISAAIMNRVNVMRILTAED